MSVTRQRTPSGGSRRSSLAPSSTGLDDDSISLADTTRVLSAVPDCRNHAKSLSCVRNICNSIADGTATDCLRALMESAFEKETLEVVDEQKLTHSLKATTLASVVGAAQKSRSDEELMVLGQVLYYSLRNDVVRLSKPSTRKLQPASVLMQTLCRILPPESQSQYAASDALASAVLVTAKFERKIFLKTRLSGLLTKLTKQLDFTSRWSGGSLLALLAFTLESPRNALSVGKSGTLVVKLTDALSSHQDTPSATFHIAQTIFFIVKHPKNRNSIPSETLSEILRILTQRYEEIFLPSLGEDLSNGEESSPETLQIQQASMVLFGCIRQMIKSRRGRDAFLSVGGAAIVEVSLKAIVEMNRQRGELDLVQTKIQTALCGASIRCLPPQLYPVAHLTFPLTFQLSGAQSTVSTTVDNRSDGSDYGGEEDDDLMASFTQASPLILMDEEEEEIVSPVIPTSTPETSKLEQYSAFHSEMFDGAAQTNRASNSPFDSRLSKHPSRAPFTETAKYSYAAQRTRACMPRVCLSYPDSIGAYPNLPQQPLRTFPNALRDTVVQRMVNARRAGTNSASEPRVVYDLDALIGETNGKPTPSEKPIREMEANDLNMIGKEIDVDHLQFESRFECGNLRRATQTGESEYELFMTPDINENSLHYQWFYFRVSNTSQETPYTFVITNGVKSRSMFEQGMQPVLFSTTEASQGRVGWVRSGYNVCYYRNEYVDSVDKPKSGVKKGKIVDKSESKGYYSARFTISFRHPRDVCYIAYHYPYTYTFLVVRCLLGLLYLQSQLSLWSSLRTAELYYRLDTLCTSLGGNAVPLLTITSRGDALTVRARPIVVLTARVHPGETNASWMMHGCISFLLSDHPEARDLRHRFVFNLVPMLNPDGVINGSHRCSLSGEDLNRQWADPDVKRHPEIYHTKNLIAYQTSVLGTKPFAFVDMHGHSRKLNTFMYGNDAHESWLANDREREESRVHTVLPDILDEIAPAFDIDSCAYRVEKSKEASARVTVWRQMGVNTAYTLEASYAGLDRGPYAGKQMGTRELQEMGRCLCEALKPLQLKLESNENTNAKFDN